MQSDHKFKIFMLRVVLRKALTMKTLWIDAITPKYAIFFSHLIPLLEEKGYTILVTTRSSPGYVEAKEILDQLKITSLDFGGYGGSSRKDKWQARQSRQQQLIEYFEQHTYPDALISGCAVDSNQLAFGLGIPIINIYDTPIADDHLNLKKVTAVSKLTIPLSSLFFYPFVLPREIFHHFPLSESQIFSYDFIDVCLWMNQLKKDPQKDFRVRYQMDPLKKTILFREEEFKAHYVEQESFLIHEIMEQCLSQLDANIVIMPRYEPEPLLKRYANRCVVLTDKLSHEEYYPFIDMLVGGGGTMNLEAVCYGIPTLSLRSLWLYHDKYLIDHQLMKWTQNTQEAMNFIQSHLGQRIDSKQYFSQGEISLKPICDKIHSFLESNIR